MIHKELLRQEIKEDIENAITQSLFGLTRLDFISDAVEFAGEEWGYTEDVDLIENALDWITLDALRAMRQLKDFSLSWLLENPYHILQMGEIVRIEASYQGLQFEADEIWSK